MVSSLSPYSTLLDLSSASEFQDNQNPGKSDSLALPGNHILRSQSLHGKQLPGNSNASGDYANLGPVGSLEDFQKFTNGYNCTSSRFGSLETMEKNAKKPKDQKVSKTESYEANNQDTESSLFNEIEKALKNSKNSSVLEHEDDDHQILYYHVEMLPMDQRFGFSVSGGTDEGFPPKIDNISKGLCIDL